MKTVCIVGAGAIGGFIGARLAATGQVSVGAVARGDTLQALSTHGWRLRQSGGMVGGPAIASDDPAKLGAQDLVIIAVKGPAMPAVAGTITPLIGPDTVVLPAMNGLPWWFGDGVQALDGPPLESVDPDGAIAAAIPAHHVLGCVVHAAAAVTEPGLVEHRMGNGLIVGEPDGSASDRLATVSALLTEAGFDVTVSGSIRREIWYKLWGNLTMNPVSAVTGATADRILDDPLVRAFCSAAMREASAIGERIGCVIDQSPEDRHEVTRKLGAFKTSMLQDAEAGRPLELDSIVAVVSEIGRRVGVDTPNVDALLGLTRLFGRVRGLYPQ
ncbi:2-dehydropantoate 2-reductase [Thalassobaculum fulvum]|uniref:2-dehydropantoate 2-reductase n=1 Tax=Thalassobaculum fulvum TaxID=1633335 RepID=A0A919CMV7_9PROT|nr:2-dehydropantoate 2-reductase [Thalassobaculum fulvum]GHD42536.1 2-dehydropantoate 2-reductase [Thalassobaculum fulvum]